MRYSYLISTSSMAAPSLIRGRIAIAVLLFAAWSATPCQAYPVYAPQFPAVSDLVGNYGVSYIYNNSVSASFQSSADSDGKTYYPSSATDLLYVPTSTNTAVGISEPFYGNTPTRAVDLTYGSVGGGGVMKAYARVEADAGPASATADLTVTFIDQMHVTRGRHGPLQPGHRRWFPRDQPGERRQRRGQRERSILRLPGLSKRPIAGAGLPAYVLRATHAHIIRR